MDWKHKIFQHLNEQVDEKIATLQKTILSAQEARNNETKSSAGDKFETGRAMMQREIENNKVQLGAALNSKGELNQINIEKRNTTIDKGSLVITNQGKYFISIGIGKVVLEEETFFCISMISPIGKMLRGKSEGDEVEFRGKKIVVVELV